MPGRPIGLSQLSEELPSLADTRWVELLHLRPSKLKPDASDACCRMGKPFSQKGGLPLASRSHSLLPNDPAKWRKTPLGLTAAMPPTVQFPDILL
jgi:hypothetical protein